MKYQTTSMETCKHGILVEPEELGGRVLALPSG